MAFVVPAEVGHAPYAQPLIRFLAGNFKRVQFVAIKEKVFPDLSEDVWFLFADGYGEATDVLLLSCVDRFLAGHEPPTTGVEVSLAEWARWNHRLRPFLLPRVVRSLYDLAMDSGLSTSLGSVAKAGIGYVTGANEFFHLRPSEAKHAALPDTVLRPTVRNGRMLTAGRLTAKTVSNWLEADEPVLLLHLTRNTEITRSTKRYLDSEAGQQARASYKCRNRTPWYVVPDVTTPQAFLPILSSRGPTLVANSAKCAATNSLLAVSLKSNWSLAQLLQAWKNPLTALSCEIEGHPLGGGVLKLEPGEAARVRLISGMTWSQAELDVIATGVEALRDWRHSGDKEAQAM
ncbi:MAG: hypothetical protein ABL971_13930 [Vicinamibacterales bacterium]